MALAAFWILGVLDPRLPSWVKWLVVGLVALVLTGFWAFHDLRRSRDWARFAHVYEGELEDFLSESRRLLSVTVSSSVELSGYQTDVTRLKENLYEWGDELKGPFPSVSRQVLTWRRERGHSNLPIFNTDHDGWQRETVRMNRRLRKMANDLARWQSTPDNPRIHSRKDEI